MTNIIVATEKQIQKAVFNGGKILFRESTGNTSSRFT